MVKLERLRSALPIFRLPPQTINMMLTMISLLEYSLQLEAALVKAELLMASIMYLDFALQP
jgi:hypothetical protein